MLNILSGLMILLMSGSAVAAAEPAMSASVHLAQFGGSDRDRNRGSLAQRYVCVVTPQRNDNRQGPKVCTTYFGPVGSSCRCQNAMGSGRVQLAN